MSTGSVIFEFFQEIVVWSFEVVWIFVMALFYLTKDPLSKIKNVVGYFSLKLTFWKRNSIKLHAKVSEKERTLVDLYKEKIFYRHQIWKFRLPLKHSNGLT